MYNSTVTPAVVGGGTGSALAYTGSNSIWMALGAFALISLGLAMARMAPKKQA